MRRVRVFAIAIAGLFTAFSALQAQDSYVQELTTWRQQREKDLQADNSWLTVAGLHFLSEGGNSFGSGPLNDIVLPEPVPADAGVLEFDGTRVVLKARSPITVNDAKATTTELRPSGDGRPADTVKFGAVTFFVHRSGDRIAIRVRDQNSPIRRNFTGLRWFEPNPAYRVTGRFEPYAEAKTVKVPNILGDLETYTAPGVVAFTLNGQEHELEVFNSGSGDNRRFFIVFRDLTSGTETYPSARFLSADLPVDGKVVLDFNRAYNPPCAFNPYTTCPLPSEQNRMRVRVEAGELIYKKADTSS